MNSATRKRITKAINEKTVLAFQGHRVRPLSITEDGKVEVLRQKASKESFRKIWVKPKDLEEIIENFYSHKSPIAFLKRKGFTPITSKEGRPMMQKVVEGVMIIIVHDDPPTKKSQGLSIMAKSLKTNGTVWSFFRTKDLNVILTKIPDMVNSAKGDRQK